METAREVILKRIEQIKTYERGFSRSLMKWNVLLSRGTITQYADEIIFDELSDRDLVLLFERILRRHHTQS